jgi:hypothetical protein
LQQAEKDVTEHFESLDVLSKNPSDDDAQGHAEEDLER